MIYPKALRLLGFSEKEILVYMTLLELDTATPAEIGHKTELNRSTCHVILTNLTKKGFASKFVKRKKIHFIAKDPRQLLRYLENEKEDALKKYEEQQSSIMEAMPELMSALNPTRTKPRVEMFEGMTAIREAYEDTLVAKDVIQAYANIETIHEALPNFFPDYYKRRVKAGISGKGIMPHNEESVKRTQNNNEEKRETRFLPNGKTFTPEVMIYNDKVLIVSWKEKMAVLIESKEFADLQRLIYGLVWEKLKTDG